MSVHFCSNHANNFIKLAGSVNIAPPANFDLAFVKQCLNLNGIGLTSVPEWRLVVPGTVTTKHFWQCRVVFGNMTSNGSPLVIFYSGPAGSLVERLRLQYNPGGGGVIRLMYLDTSGVPTWTQIGGSLALTAGTLYTLTVEHDYGPAGAIRFFVNNALIGQYVGNTATINPAGAITHVDWQNPSANTGATAVSYLAEVIIAKDENPYLMKVNTHVLQANSAVNVGWTGNVGDVDDNDPSSADIINTATIGHVRTFTIDALPPTGALVVRAVQVSAMARRGTSGPQNLQLTLRASGVNQNSPTKALQTGFNTTYHVFEQNSVTGAEFTKAEIDASEPGPTAVA